MPPPTREVDIPTTRGTDALQWMQAHGIYARIPPIRASSYQKLLSCPFQYYLSERLGLFPALSWSEALSRGSWFHKRLEVADHTPEEVAAFMTHTLNSRFSEIREIAKATGIVGDQLGLILQKEEEDCRTSWAWFDAACEVPITTRPLVTFGPTLNKYTGEVISGYFQHPRWKLLGRELLVTVSLPGFRTPLAGRLDALYHNLDSNTLWILDGKTCREAPRIRLAICPVEFATRHYLFMTQELLDSGLLHSRYQLPSDVKLGGMVHVAFQKPTINFAQCDRDYTLDTTPLKSGPRKGEPRNEKVFFGEPRIHNYLTRCRAWYLSKGEYEALRPARETLSDDPTTGPPVNMSWTSASILDEDTLLEYRSQLEFIHEYATRNPVPFRFPRVGSSCLSFSRLTPYFPFYVTPPKDWPEVIQVGRFIQKHRDENIEADTPTQIH
jgi:hypothetical protein